MRVPGVNVFNLATKAIATTSVKYFKFKSRVTADDGELIDSFYPEITVSGSLQPVPRAKYEYMGLDFIKNYYYFYTKKNMQEVDRDVAGDEFTWCGQRFKAEGKDDWAAIDGWVAILAVQL